MLYQSHQSYYFNPRSRRGGATTVYYKFDNAEIISIHAPHEGERLSGTIIGKLPTFISIHAPHEGERLIHIFNRRSYHLFQSTLPTRGSDHILLAGKNNKEIFQSTLPTRGSDKSQHNASSPHRYFNPRSPRGGATTAHIYPILQNGISIHAPHEGERQK